MLGGLGNAHSNVARMVSMIRGRSRMNDHCQRCQASPGGAEGYDGFSGKPHAVRGVSAGIDLASNSTPRYATAPMRIGDHNIEPATVLAPMASITNPPLSVIV